MESTSLFDNFHTYLEIPEIVVIPNHKPLNNGLKLEELDAANDPITLNIILLTIITIVFIIFLIAKDWFRYFQITEKKRINKILRFIEFTKSNYGKILFAFGVAGLQLTMCMASLRKHMY
ncbi:uncharacterized protein LOC119602869 [Lucilia sericata]|uniref:uncharacterized protein LOC119602869 n=1 Tax=Lucilia sericata TaxID=13632 RepID=UPI0018A80797|nr:uncharacterized protein LOC119602869 [Lucilia sericata]